MKKILVFISLTLVLLTGCDSKKLETLEYKEYEDGNRVVKTIDYYETKKTTNYVLIDTSKGKIIAELYPDIAPITVKNFQTLIKQKFYHNLTFHRVIQNFMIQTGDPTATGNGGSQNTIKGEFLHNGFNNPLSHTRGVLSMARTSNDMNSASSQFFIVHADSTYLDGQYASFGKVIAGLEVVDMIATVKTDENDKPLNTVKLNYITFIEIEKG